MPHDLLTATIVPPGEPPRLRRRPAGERLGLRDKANAETELLGLVSEMARLQNRLWAENRRSVLLVLQGMDAAGKDGTIRRVFSGVNPQGCSVSSFKVPSAEELDHDYLWRVHARCPRRGQIGIFNRSHYEDIVTVGVLGLHPPDEVRRRLLHVNEFERMLSDEGTEIVKVFLHISRDEQRRRLQKRLDDPEKRWKFNVADLDTRKHWRAFQSAYEDTIAATSTDHAPWYIVPADHRWVRDVMVATILVSTLQRMNPQLPPEPDGLDGLEVE